MSLNGPEIVREARAWRGTPWHHGACLRGVGCDCIGLIAGVGRALGVPEAKAWLEDTRFRGYGRLPKADDLRAACEIYLDPLPIPQATLGDILLFTFWKEPMHFGIVSNSIPLRAIHAYEPVGCVVENSMSGKWGRRMVGAFRYRGKE